MTENDKDKSTLPSDEHNHEVEKASHLEEQEHIKPTEQIKPTANRLMSRSVTIMLILMLVVAAGVAGGGWWLWSTYQRDFETLKQEQQVLLEELQASERKIAGFEQLNSKTNRDWQAGVKSLEAMVVESAQRMSRQANRTADRWPLEEALTLSRLAQQRLQLDSNAQVAVGLLKSADSIFSTLDAAAVLPIRRQLASDILALQNTQAVDINGYYFALDAIAAQIKALQWVPKPVTQTDIPDDSGLVGGFWHGLKQAVVVTRLDVPMQAPPLQTDFERWRQHSLLLLEQTQLALLARNQPLYDAALTQLVDRLGVMNGQLSLSVIEDNLRKLQDAVLNPIWPNIGTSVDVIEQYLAETEAQTESASEVETEAAQ